MGQKRPNDSSDFVRQGNDGHVPMLGLQQLHKPGRLHPLSSRHGTSAMDDQSAQVRITWLANAQQANPPTGDALPRHDSKPR